MAGRGPDGSRVAGPPAEARVAAASLVDASRRSPTCSPSRAVDVPFGHRPSFAVLVVRAYGVRFAASPTSVIDM